MIDLPTHASSDSLAERLPTYAEFVRRYSALPRQLFVEVAIALARRPVRAILDISCEPLAALRARWPDVRVDAAGIDSLANIEDEFDLVLGYSVLRLSGDAAAALSHIRRLLRPDGLAYLVDFRRDLPAETRAHLIGRLETEAFREYLTAQLDAAFSLAEVNALLERANVHSYRLAAGGLAGYPAATAAAYALLARNDEIARILMRLAGYGFRSVRAADLVFHLFIEHTPENDDAD